MNKLLKGEKMQYGWRKIVLIPIYKSKGDSKECGNYWFIKLMSHTMKSWEWVVKSRRGKEVLIGDQQLGFMPQRSTTYTIFHLRMLTEKWKQVQKDLHCVFIDLDGGPIDELWECWIKLRSKWSLLSPSKTCMKEQEYQWEVQQC